MTRLELHSLSSVETRTLMDSYFLLQKHASTHSSSVDTMYVCSGEQVMSSIPGWDIPKSLKMVLATPRLALETYWVELGMVDPVSG